MSKTFAGMVSLFLLRTQPKKSNFKHKICRFSNSQRKIVRGKIFQGKINKRKNVREKLSKISLVRKVRQRKTLQELMTVLKGR